MSDLVVPSVSVSRDIPAPASAIFAVLANPSMHPRLDGTGMARRGDDVALTKVGDVFVIDMTHWSLGDYGMENLVVEFEPDRRIVWQPVGHTYQSAGFDKMLAGITDPEVRYWGWELRPLDDGATRVTEFYDCSRLSDGLRQFMREGDFWRKGMAISLENLEKLVLSAGTSDPVETTQPVNYFEVQQAD